MIWFKSYKSFENSQQNNLKTEHDKEIPKERYISLEERQKITNNPGINIKVY